MSTKDKSKPSARAGKKLGGDEHPTFAWGGDKSAPGASISGKLISVQEVKTRYGVRTRLALLSNAALTCEMQDTGEVVIVDAGKTVGVWMPERWATALKPSLNANVEIFRDIDGTQIRYDARAL